MHQASNESIHNAPSAGLFWRLGALLYDSFLVAAIWMLLGFIVQLFVGPDTSTLVDGRVQTDPFLDKLLFFLMVTSAMTFYVWFWCHSGQTLGMLAWRIKLVSRSGTRVNPNQALIRWLLAWPSFFLLGAGYFWMYFNAERDTLHDRLSHSRVIRLPKPAA